MIHRRRLAWRKNRRRRRCGFDSDTADGFCYGRLRPGPTFGVGNRSRLDVLPLQTSSISYAASKHGHEHRQLSTPVMSLSSRWRLFPAVGGSIFGILSRCRRALRYGQ